MSAEVLRSLRTALVATVIFAALFLAMRTDAPLRAVLAALPVGAMFGVTTYRQARGKTLLPTWALLALGIGGLTLYGWTLLTGRWSAAGAEWIAVVVVFAFPIAILWMAYSQWKRRV